MAWRKVVCHKCDRKFAGEYKDGTEVYCSECNYWTVVEKEVKNATTRDKR